MIHQVWFQFVNKMRENVPSRNEKPQKDVSPVYAAF